MSHSFCRLSVHTPAEILVAAIFTRLSLTRAHSLVETVMLAATKISAGVSTGIGSHVDDIEDKGDDQFEISDERSVDEVYDALLKNNLQPVMSDYIYV